MYRRPLDAAMSLIGVLTIHGMGTQDERFDAGLRTRLRKAVGARVAGDLVFQRLYYQDQIQGQQAAVWARMQRAGLSWKWLHRFFLYFFSDAVTYQYKPGRQDSVYGNVHTALKDQIDALHVRLGGRHAPLVVIASSLGGHVISNHIWDAQRGGGIWESRPASHFQQLGTTALMFTTGCNIPLFASGHSRVEAINKPNPRFRWINYYSRPDILGWPLKPLSSGFENSYNEVVEEDRRKWLGFTPLAHTRYWRWGSVVGDMAREIRQLHARM
ncbi:MAG: hypothetical protein OEV06_02120 [Anaerolineae bacterium]|nr:hypothetical protein [Anaerolineae bacterium]